MRIYRQLMRMFFYIGLFLMPLTFYSFYIGSENVWAFIGINVLLILPGMFDILLTHVGKFIDIIAFHIIKPKVPWNIEIKEEGMENGVRMGELVFLIALSWLIAAFVFSIIFVMSGFSWVDALFETMSGLTTSGLSVMDVGKLNNDLILLRSFLGWVGGLGILGFGLSALRGITGRKMAEIYGIEDRNFVSAIRKVFGAYVLLTIVSFFLLLYSGFSPFHALNLAMAGISNNGFYPFQDYQLTEIQKDMLSIVMIMGSISIGAYAFLIFDKKIKAFINEDLLFYMGILAIGVWLFSTLSNVNLIESAHYIITTATTGGFDIADMRSINDSQAFMLTIMMLIGGMHLSTAGGIHSSRVLIIIKTIIHKVKEMFNEARVEKIKFRGQVIDDEDVINTLIIAFLYIMTFAIFSLIFMADGHTFRDSTIMVSSALGNVGVSTLNTSALPDIEKIYLIFLMYIGRIEIIPLITIIYKIISSIRIKMIF